MTLYYCILARINTIWLFCVIVPGYMGHYGNSSKPFTEKTHVLNRIVQAKLLGVDPDQEHPAAFKLVG